MYLTACRAERYYKVVRTIYHLKTYHDITKYHITKLMKFVFIIYANHTASIGQYQNTDYICQPEVVCITAIKYHNFLKN